MDWKGKQNALPSMEFLLLASVYKITVHQTNWSGGQ